MATAKKKIERVYTAKDIESNDLEYAKINKLNMEINSIDEDDIKNLSNSHPEQKMLNPRKKMLSLRELFSTTQPTFARN